MRPVGTHRQQDLGLQAVGVLVLVDEHVVEVPRDVLREPRLLHHRVPEQQQVVVVEQRELLLALDVVAEDLRQLLGPAGAPGELRLERLLQRTLRVDAVRIDAEADILAREALVELRETELLADRIDEVGGVATIEDREVRVEVQVPGVVAQQPRADRMEGAGPLHALQHRLADAGDRLVQRLLDDVARAAAHLERGTARERQHQDPARIDAVDHEVCHPRGQRAGLAGAGSGDDQQRPAAKTLGQHRLAVGHGAALGAVQRLQVCGRRGHRQDYT